MLRAQIGQQSDVVLTIQHIEAQILNHLRFI